MTGPAPAGPGPYSSVRGRIVPPDLDDRTWQDLVDQMHTLIPRYAPTWTDHNPSDIGVALVELFAWLAEGVIYRLNRVPDKNYVAFLNLLGITRDPATPAQTHLTFGASRATTVPAGTQVQTDAREGERSVVFETDEPVDVLPTNLVAAVLVAPAAARPPVYTDVTAAVVGPPAATLPVSLAANATLQLCLGFDAPTTAALPLRLRLFPPLPGPSAPGGPAPVTVAWVSSHAADEPLAWPAVPGAADDTAGLLRDGTVLLTPPADWAEQRPTAPQSGGPPATTWTATPGGTVLTRPLRWLGIRLVNTTATAQAVGLDRVLVNAALARTALTVRAPEPLGTSTGAPFQTFALVNRPLYRSPDLDDPYGHLVVQVGPGDPAPWETWTAVDDLPAGAGRVHRLNPVTGEVVFGNFDERAGTGHGTVPPAGSQVRALTYRYVAAGADGNVAADRVRVLSSGPTGAVASVTNAGPARDGADEEPVEETMRRAPDELKIRDRAVTAEDYEFLAREASNEVVHSRCLTPRLQVTDGPKVPNPAGGQPVPAWRTDDPWAFAGIRRAPGNVTVVVVPRQDTDRPEPTPSLLRDVTAHLDRRRDLTAHLDVVGPRYLPILADVEVVIWLEAQSAGVDPATVRADIRAEITAFLHPTRGGPGGTGWQVGQHVFSSDLFRAIMPPSDVGFISRLGIRPDVPLYHLPPLNPDGTAANFNADLERPFPLSPFGATVRVADYELVCAPDPALHAIASRNAD